MCAGLYERDPIWIYEEMPKNFERLSGFAYMPYTTEKDDIQREMILNTVEEKLDEQNVLHLRIDKQKAYLGDVELIEGGDAIVVKAKIVTYPAKREKVIEAIKSMLK
mgnify:CR=1 FL=1